MATQKERLDIILMQQGYFSSRERARSSIMAGKVFVDGQRVDKAGTRFPLDVQVTVQGSDLPYVSRGGLKLKQAIDHLGFCPDGKIILDVGASTGGFTDCALQHGASKVYAIDVGYAQLAWSLRQDARVIVLERTNVRYLTKEQVPELADGATIDVSFISLRLVLPALLPFLKEDAEIVALIKPQFEAGREQVGKRGVVKGAEVHHDVILGVWEKAWELGLGLVGLTHSPIKGPEGNIEFLAYFKRGSQNIISKEQIEQVVSGAHQQL